MAFANSIGARWSGPPGDDPPPTGTAPGSAFHASISWSMSWYGESFATTTMSGSSMSFAIGVVSCSDDGELFVWTLPTTPRPIDITSFSLPASFTSLPSPTVPPAPGRLNTSTLRVRSASSMALAAVLAVMS
jgi:hypothetical protein